MNGAAALYYNSPALDDGDDGSSGSKQQTAAAAAATGAGWGGGWRLLEHATRFWRIDKTSASDRETTHTHTHRHNESTYHAHTHTHSFIYTLVCLCEIVAVVSAFTPTTKSTGLGCWCSLSLSLSFLSLSRWNVCCFCVACIKGNPIDIYICRRLMQLTFQCQAATHTTQTAWLSITFYNNKTQITFPTLSPPTYLLYVVSRCTSSLHRKCFWYRQRWFASRLVWVCRLMMIGWMLSKAKYKKRQSPVWVRQRESVWDGAAKPAERH